MKFEGYQKVYRETREQGDGRGKALEEEQPLPTMKVGDDIPVKKVTPSQHFTEPPPRYSEASLVKELERLGIGRPSTYASIISTLVDRRYAQLEQRRFFPTELGDQVERVMVKSFPDIFNVQFTSHMETDLDRVEEGDVNWRMMLKEFYGPFAISLKEADIEELIAEAHDLSALETERCPVDGGKLVARGGFFGPFIACENHPKTCKFTRPLRGERKVAQPTDQICHECGAPMVIRHGRSGEFLGLQQVPEMPRNAIDADRREVSEGRRRHRRAPLEEARQGVLRMRQLSRVRFRHLGQAGSRSVSGVRVRRRRVEVEQDARRVSSLHQLCERMGARGRSAG